MLCLEQIEVKLREIEQLLGLLAESARDDPGMGEVIACLRAAAECASGPYRQHARSRFQAIVTKLGLAVPDLGLGACPQSVPPVDWIVAQRWEELRARAACGDARAATILTEVFEPWVTTRIATARG